MIGAPDGLESSKSFQFGERHPTNVRARAKRIIHGVPGQNAVVDRNCHCLMPGVSVQHILRICAERKGTPALTEFSAILIRK